MTVGALELVTPPQLVRERKESPVAVFETDWLASEPVFFNTTTSAASKNINEVIEFADLELDGPGLAAYLDAGFCVFDRTPIRDVRIVPPSARLVCQRDGRLRVEPVGTQQAVELGRKSSEAEVLEILRAKVEEIETSTDGPIVIPTSGGYDSRLLNLMVGDKRRIRSFTYGVSDRQRESIEVSRAQALSRILGTEWERVPIGFFHLYFDDWDRLFGPAVHAHGMYHLEFYRQVVGAVPKGSLLLTGLCGDWLSGKGDFLADRPVTGPADVPAMIMTNGMTADSSRMLLRGNARDVYEEYLEQRRELLGERALRVVEMVRFRMMLLHYLKRVPAHFGFDVRSPLVDVDVAAAMLALPPGRRRDRRWLGEYFSTQGVGLQDVSGQSEHWLFWNAMRYVPLQPLSESVLREIVDPEYVRWINGLVGRRGLSSEALARLRYKKGLRRFLQGLGRWGVRPRRMEAYCAYLTLWPLQQLLLRRDDARRRAA